jgi:hypothetical protein
MKDANRVRWTISVPKETDLSLRNYLAKTGLKKDSLSDFVAQAVRWRLFDLNVNAARARSSGLASSEIEDSIDRALTQVRSARSRKPA